MNKLFISLFILFSHFAHAASEQILVADSQAAIKDFSSRLKTELQQGMQQGGPVAAIQICKNVAADISHKVSQQYGWKIGRTSLKVRNPENAPDPWETRVLKDFEIRRANGEDPGTMTAQEIVDVNGQRMFRYMQAIPTGSLCLACHGDPIAPQISAKLKQLYPQDQATGFKIGDIRGAFTITRKID